MKVLQFTSTYPQYEGDSIPPFVKVFAEGLVESGHDVTVLLPNSPSLDVSWLSKKLRICPFRYCFRKFERLAYGSGILSNLKHRPILWLLFPLFMFGACLAYSRLVRKQRWDFVHAHWILPQGLVAVLCNLLIRNPPPLIVTSHGADLFALESKIARAVRCFVLKRIDIICVVSQAMKQRIVEEIGLEDFRIWVAPMGVDLRRVFIPAQTPVRKSRSVVFVGRLVEKKGVKYLVDAFSRVVEQYPDALLTIVGGGVESERIASRIKALNLEHCVSMLGPVANDKLPAILAQHSIAVMPAIIGADGDQEGLGLAAVEAMGCECAVVSSDLPAIRDVIVDEVNGLLVPEKNIEVLAAAIIRLMEQPEYANKLALEGRRSVLERFDWQAVIANYESIYRQLSYPRG